MITILLARHGQASFGQNNYDKLSDLGGKQAKMLGLHYAHTKRRIDAIYSGSLVRQQDSASHFWQSYRSFLSTDNQNSVINAKSLSQIASADSISKQADHILPAFNEFNHHDVFIKSNPAFAIQGTISAEIAKSDRPQSRLGELFDQALQRWHSGAHDEDYEESWPMFNSRARQALEQIHSLIVQDDRLNEDSSVLVFTSGGVIAAIVAHLLGQGSQTAYQLNRSLVNTGVTAITLREQGPSLLSLNEYSHLFADGERFVTWR